MSGRPNPRIEPPTDGLRHLVRRRGGVQMPTTKRSIAIVAGVAAGLIVVALLATIGAAVRETNSDADPDRAFSATEVVPRALAGRVEWNADDEPLARTVEPATREQLTATWLRAHDALERATVGDSDGLDVWFVGPALDHAAARHDRRSSVGDVSARGAVAHELTVRFYSLDGQVAVLTSDTTYERRPSGGGDVVANSERLEAIIVLADGNWRIRNLTRVTA